MIICSCNVISDGDVRAVVGPQSGAASTAQSRGLGTAQCGRCAGSIRKIMDEVPETAAHPDTKEKAGDASIRPKTGTDGSALASEMGDLPNAQCSVLPSAS